MGTPLPKQVRWADFVRAVRAAGYEGPYNRGNGSIRHFVHPTRLPRIVTCHEPHPSSVIPAGSLRAYVDKFKLTNEEFIALLNR